MNQFDLTFLSKNEVQQTFTKCYFNLKKYLEKYRDKGQTPGGSSLQKLVQPLMGNIGKGAFSECDPEAYSYFLSTASTMLRTIIDNLAVVGPLGADTMTALQASCDWLCSLASIGPADLSTKRRVGSIWACSRLVGMEDAPTDLLALADLISSALLPMQVPQESLHNIARTEIILFVTAKLEEDKKLDVNTLDVIRRWCQDLLAQETLPNDLRRAARRVGLDLPPIQSTNDEKAGSSKKLPFSPKPIIFKLPEIIPEDAEQMEFEQCLMKLLSVSIDHMLESQLWTKVTAERVEQLAPDSKINFAVATFYFAAVGLWEGFWKQGSRQELEVARELARFAYSYNKSHEAPLHVRNSALHLLMNLQLPDLIRISNVQDMKADAGQLFRVETCQFSSLLLMIGLVQVHAGECRALKAEGDEEGSDELLMMNGEQLRQVHKEYERSAKERRPEEVEAWLFLEPEINRVLGSHSGQPSVNKNFVELVNRGNLKDVYDYLDNQLDQVRIDLEQKLVDYRLSGDHLMEPIGRIYLPNAPRRNTLLPAFENAKKMLADGQYTQAASEFGDIAERQGISIVQRQISRDYQAYVLAKQGKFIQAKPLLRDLTQSTYSYSSAFWNLACIEGERPDQLAALTLGLQRAPHMRMLHAVVYLSVTLNQNQDEQACRWLSVLPFMEAQMLYYHHEFNHLGGDDAGRIKRETVLKRISAYIEHGDPETLDPTKPRPQLTDINHFLDSLKQRDHQDVMGFWFTCHEPFEGAYKENRDRTNYYMTKSDILSEIGLKREAAESFEDELKGRLGFLDILGARVTPAVINGTRKRVEARLRGCMTPGLESLGKRIYRHVQEYDKTNKHGTKVLLFGEQQRKIHEFYGGGSLEEPLADILVRVSQETRSKLHSLANYPDQKPVLRSLVDGLQKHKKNASAEALESLLSQWDNYQQQNTSEERKALTTEVTSAFALLEGGLQKELSSTEWEMANGVFSALRRVNGRLAQGERDQPKIKISILDEIPPSFAGTSKPTAFALRVSSLPGSAEVRLTDATARMQNSEVNFLLRDNLLDFPVILSPSQSAVLAFEEPGDVAVTEVCVLELELSYDYAGQHYNTGTIRTTVQPRPYLFQPIQSPYIFNRWLEPHEIEGHFFGRDKEEGKVFDLISASAGRTGYVEGIRRTGKTSLFSSIRHHIEVEDRRAVLSGKKFIPVHIRGGSVSSFLQVGQMLEYFFSEIVRHPEISAAGVTAPSEEACCNNLTTAYRMFEDELSNKLPEQSVLAFWDDFQAIVDLADEVGNQDSRFLGIKALLEVIRDFHRVGSKLIWLLAGYRFWMRFRDQLPGVNLWAELDVVPIDFLDKEAVRDIMVSPLQSSAIHVPKETVARVYQLTCGHPETVQRMAHKMLELAQQEGRPILMPADADQAASIFGATQGLFADTWCPLAELTSKQKKLIGRFLSAVPTVGGHIEPHRLVDGRYTDADRKDVDDLVARKIMGRHSGGVITIKAPVLEVWLRNHWKDEAPPSVAAVFVDLANLTYGTGNDEIVIEGMSIGDVLAGRFKLKTVLDLIDQYAALLTPAPVGEKWGINYPKGSKASSVANLNDYQLVNIPEDIFEKGRKEKEKRGQKGTDDAMLQIKLAEVLSERPAISHVVLVTGDKDFRIVGVESPLKKGKNVHVITTKAAGAHSYSVLARIYPERCKIVFLEDLLAAQHSL